MAVPGLESYIVVIVDEVDLANRLVHVKDKTGSKFQAFFRDHPGGWFYVPNQGEKWTAKKIGNFWHPEHMLDSLDDHTWAADNLHPGDLVVRAGKIWIMGALAVTAGLTTQAITTGSLPTVIPVSGAAFQCTAVRDVFLIVPVTYNPTAGAAATCKVELSPNGITYSTLTTEQVPPGIVLDNTVRSVSVSVPAGWRVKLTVTNAALGTGTYY